MPLETIVVRAIVQIPLRLVHLRGSCVATHYIKLLVRSHDQCVSVVFSHTTTVHSDNLHKALPLVAIADIIFESIKD